jgi:pimeloyl-ACP methyl ester carboxylesterase
VYPFYAAVRKEDFLQPHDLRSLTVPTALLWGVDDRFLPPGSLEFFRDNLPPDAAIWLLSRCGHLPMWDRPWSVNACIETFAQQLVATGATALPARPPGGD